MQEADFSKYGKSFQESLAYLFLEDRPFSDQLEEVLDVEFFELKYLRVFTSLIMDYKTKYKTQPTKDIMSSGKKEVTTSVMGDAIISNLQ